MTRVIAVYFGEYIVKYCGSLREAHDYIDAQGWMDDDEVKVVAVRRA